MAVLNSWQKIDRVLAGQPFGTGVDGAYSSATVPTVVYKTCAGTATQTKFAADTDATPFAVGDVILLHQTRGTGAGQWEIVKVASLGSDEYNTTTALNYTYTDSGASQAQAVKIPQYTDVTVQTGTWTVPAWDGNVGGILPLAANKTVTVTGTISATTKGFLGGAGVRGRPSNAIQGEGTSGAGAGSTSANGNGGGGGYVPNSDSRSAGGGGGGHGASGTSGSVWGDGCIGGTGGETAGAADLTNIVPGGAGGGGANDGGGADTVGNGGAAGGIVLIFGKVVIMTGSVVTNGGNGGNSTTSGAGGGGGAGGSALIVCATATLGTNLVTVAAGSGGTGASNAVGGAGAVGRIAVHHSGTITGTTNPTFTDVTDTSLVESGGGAFFAFF